MTNFISDRIQDYLFAPKAYKEPKLSVIKKKINRCFDK